MHPSVEMAHTAHVQPLCQTEKCICAATMAAQCESRQEMEGIGSTTRPRSTSDRSGTQHSERCHCRIGTSGCRSQTTKTPSRQSRHALGRTWRLTLRHQESAFSFWYSCSKSNQLRGRPDFAFLQPDIRPIKRTNEESLMLRTILREPACTRECAICFRDCAMARFMLRQLDLEIGQLLREQPHHTHDRWPDWQSRMRTARDRRQELQQNAQHLVPSNGLSARTEEAQPAPASMRRG